MSYYINDVLIFAANSFSFELSGVPPLGVSFDNNGTLTALEHLRTSLTNTKKLVTCVIEVAT